MTRSIKQGFPGSSVAKNLPANAGDTGSILDPGDPTAAEQLSLRTTTIEPVLWRLGTTMTQAHAP